LDAGSDSHTASNDAASGGDHPPEVRVGRLDTIPRVREEMSRLYKAARRVAGPRPSPSDATKLGWLLNAIGASIQGTELAARIEALEERAKGRS